MNIVYFLGAGFSKPLGLPLMGEFYDFARGERSPLDGEERNFVRELRQRLTSVASMLDADERNLEDLLSVSLIDDDGWPGPVNHRLLTILWKIYRGIVPESAAFFGSVMNRLVQRERIDEYHTTVITTNYDVVAELAFHSIGRPLGLPGEWEPIAEEKTKHVLYDPRGSTRIICKLHGSVNWFLQPTSDSPETLRVDGRIARMENFALDDVRSYTIPAISRSKHSIPDPPPLIVPPTLYKGSYPPCFNATWQAARKALRQADRVVFVGYSFPRSDTYMKYFLTTSLSKSMDLKSVDILDPDADNIVTRLRSDDEMYGSTFKRNLRAIPGVWEKANYNVLD